MRCAIGEKKLRKYSALAGVNFVRGLVRGNTNHRVDLITEDGSQYTMYPNFQKPLSDAEMREREKKLPVNQQLSEDFVAAFNKAMSDI